MHKRCRTNDEPPKSNSPLARTMARWHLQNPDQFIAPKLARRIFRPQHTTRQADTSPPFIKTPQAGYHDTPPLVGGHPREAVRTRRHLTRNLREAVSCQGVTPGWEHEEACYNQGHVVMRSRTPRRARSQPRHISGTRTPMCTGTGWGSTLPGHGHTQRTRDLCDDWVLIPVLLDGWHQSRTLTLQVPHYTYTCQHRQDCSHNLDFYLWVTIVTSWKLFYPIN